MTKLKIANLIACAVLITTCAARAEEGAKGLFYEQMEKPSQSLNTGVQYWIELHRGSQVSKVNNKTSFQSGDRIRFHVKSNIDAFAYVILKEGSRGEKSVLFPDPNYKDDPKVVRGRVYSLPGDGSYLTFDQNPGTEKLNLILSRTPVDPDTFLSDPRNENTVIASAAGGSKDLIPAKIVLAYDQPSTSNAPPAHTYVPPVTVASTPVVKPVAIKSALAVKPTTHGKPGKHPVTTTLASTQKPSPVVSIPFSSPSPTGVVTVVNRNPTSVLALDIVLDHVK